MPCFRGLEAFRGRFVALHFARFSVTGERPGRGGRPFRGGGLWQCARCPSATNTRRSRHFGRGGCGAGPCRSSGPAGRLPQRGVLHYTPPQRARQGSIRASGRRTLENGRENLQKCSTWVENVSCPFGRERKVRVPFAAKWLTESEAERRAPHGCRRPQSDRWLQSPVRQPGVALAMALGFSMSWPKLRSPLEPFLWRRHLS
jgi:hypothetical protein